MTRRMGRETFCRLLPEAFEAFAARQAAVLGLDGQTAASRPAPAGRERAAS
jgi:hypothetical protein